ncbi:MAG: 30S ribosomal protein S20 [Opitutaceae bacterium]|nr:30S ribosomal protein S20 [Opitutaceae bacterium]
MANTKSALKNDRKRVVRTVRNRSMKTRIKTLFKKFQEDVSSGNADAAKSSGISYISAVDKAVKKKIFHAHCSDRAKSRVSKQGLSA